MPLFSPSFLSPRPGGVTDWLAVKVPDHDVDKAGLRAHAEHGFVPVSRVTPKRMEYYRGPVSLSLSLPDRPTASLSPSLALGNFLTAHFHLCNNMRGLRRRGNLLRGLRAQFSGFFDHTGRIACDRVFRGDTIRGL